MGFGSYDESEQENQEMNASDDEAEGINIHDSDHDGEVQFETDVPTDTLVDKLDDMKASQSDD
jgi:hypothetical protein